MRPGRRAAAAAVRRARQKLWYWAGMEKYKRDCNIGRLGDLARGNTGRGSYGCKKLPCM